MIPSELVHYTKKEIALENILSEKQIKFGLFGKTNDPKESTLWHHSVAFSIKDNINSRPENFHFSKIELINQVMKKEWKILCLTKHSSYNPHKTLSAEFSKAYSHPRMWSEYGENHTGICIIFDGKKLNQNINNNISKDHRVFHGSVEYSNLQAVVANPINVPYDRDLDNEEIRRYFFNFYKQNFLKKVVDWNSEHEYRWLIHDTSHEPIFIPIEGAIKGVIVGKDFPKVYENSLIVLCKELNILAGKITWFNGMPRVNLNEIYSPNTSL